MSSSPSRSDLALRPQRRCPPAARRTEHDRRLPAAGHRQPVPRVNWADYRDNLLADPTSQSDCRHQTVIRPPNLRVLVQQPRRGLRHGQRAGYERQDRPLDVWRVTPPCPAAGWLNGALLSIHKPRRCAWNALVQAMESARHAADRLVISRGVRSGIAPSQDPCRPLDKPILTGQALSPSQPRLSPTIMNPPGQPRLIS